MKSETLLVPINWQEVCVHKLVMRTGPLKLQSRNIIKPQCDKLIDQANCYLIEI